MSDAQTRGGFAGDPAAALEMTGSEGCCGSLSTELVSPDPADSAAAPCCGAGAEAAGGCCGAAAKAEAVASGQGCCG